MKVELRPLQGRELIIPDSIGFRHIIPYKVAMFEDCWIVYALDKDGGCLYIDPYANYLPKSTHKIWDWKI